MVYVVEENLYLEDGSNPPLQLTYSGEDGYPIFSEDGEIIVFFRGILPRDLYAISADGTQERALVTNDKLMALGLGYDEFSEVGSLSFVPGSHRLIFNTHTLKPGQGGLIPVGNKDLFLVDTDTSEFKILLPPGHGGGYEMSPDGSLVAYGSSGHIDVINTHGQLIRRNLVTYAPSEPIELIPDIHWLPDSTELTVFLPVETYYDMEAPETYALWRYALDGRAGVQIPVDPPPIGSDYRLSPDGNWLVYNYFYYPGKTDIDLAGLYISNLQEGRTKLYAPEGASPSGWSPDSMHFVYGVNPRLFLGAADRSPAFIDEGYFQGWIDASRYLYSSNQNRMIMMGEIGGKPVIISDKLPVELLTGGVAKFNFIFLD